MAKANYKCSCGKTRIVNFTPGQAIAEVTCECGNVMQRQFGMVNIGYIEENDLLATGMMMAYQTPKVVR